MWVKSFTKKHHERNIDDLFLYVSFLRIIKNQNNTFWTHLAHILFDVKVWLFFTILAYFGEMVRFWAIYIWPEGAGTSYKIFWAQNILYLRFCKLKLHAKMSPPLSRPNFVQKPRFLPIFSQWKTFETAVSRRRPAGGPTKFFGRSYTTFKHPIIMLGWSHDPKGSSQKKLPPPKTASFWGGG